MACKRVLSASIRVYPGYGYQSLKMKKRREDEKKGERHFLSFFIFSFFCSLALVPRIIRDNSCCEEQGRRKHIKLGGHSTSRALFSIRKKEHFLK